MVDTGVRCRWIRVSVPCEHGTKQRPGDVHRAYRPVFLYKDVRSIVRECWNVVGQAFRCCGT